MDSYTKCWFRLHPEACVWIPYTVAEVDWLKGKMCVFFITHTIYCTHRSQPWVLCYGSQLKCVTTIRLHVVLAYYLTEWLLLLLRHLFLYKAHTHFTTPMAGNWDKTSEFGQMEGRACTALCCMGHFHKKTFLLVLMCCCYNTRK